MAKGKAGTTRTKAEKRRRCDGCGVYGHMYKDCFLLEKSEEIEHAGIHILPIEEIGMDDDEAPLWLIHRICFRKSLPLYLFINSLTPKSVLAGTKNSRSEGFLLVKHKHTNIPTTMEPFAPPTAWDLWILPIVPRSYAPTLFQRGWVGGWWKGCSRINKLNEKIIYFYCLSL
jgi:hypothetical protein